MGSKAIIHSSFLIDLWLVLLAGAIKTNMNNKQVLDKLQVERERGITVKAQTASIVYEYNDEVNLL